MRPNCPKCSKPDPKKNGHALNRQRWKCKACDFEYTRTDRTDKLKALRLQAVNLYEIGYSSNQVAAMLKISSTSVLKWARTRTFPHGRVFEIKPRLTFPPEIRSELRNIREELASLQLQLNEYPKTYP